jgi:hypothetical protein
MSVLARIRYENSIEDIVAFHRHVNAGAMQQSMTRNCRIIVLAVVLGTVLCWLLGLLSSHPTLLLVVALILTPVLLLIARANARRAWETAFHNIATKGRNATVYCEHTLEATEGSLNERTEASLSHTALWALEGIATTPDHTFIHVGSHKAHVVPRKHLFDGDHDEFVAALAGAITAAGGNAGPPPA